MPFYFNLLFFGGISAFGDGTYSGNIMQGGVALQPQDYLLDGITPMPRCIVITRPATIAPDGTARIEPIARGWLKGRSAWGRPVDVLVMPDGALLVSDDRAGLLYRITYR